MSRIIRRITALATATFFWLILVLASGAVPVSALAVTITSPTANQELSGKNVSITGTTSPKTTVVLYNGSTAFAQTVSDASGQWSVTTPLPPGTLHITAKATQNPQFGYFTSILSNGETKFNQIRYSDSVINPTAGWPIAIGPEGMIFRSSPTQNVLYSGNPFGFGSPSGKTMKIDLNNPFSPQLATGYAPSSTAMTGAYSLDGAKYYAPVNNTATVNVINVATNAYIKTIDLNNSSFSQGAWTSPSSGKIYIPMTDSHIGVINANNDTVDKTITVPCNATTVFYTVEFSQDAAYPYYFVKCKEDKVVHRYKVADDSHDAQFSIDKDLNVGMLSLDNSRVFYGSFPEGASGWVYVYDTKNFNLLKTIDLSGMSIGFLPSADQQRIYVSVQGQGFDQTKIDIIDMETQSVVSTVNTPGVPLPLERSLTEVATATTDVTFVLSAETNAGTTGAGAISGGVAQLADTGAATLVLSILAAVLLLITLAYTYRDYRKHRKALEVAAGQSVGAYTYWHHLRVVSIPLARYRVSFRLEKLNPDKSNKIRHI